MKIKGLVDEDFVNFKLPVMYIAFPSCTFKCDIENGAQLCQNCEVARQPSIEISNEEIIERYISNPITEGIVLSGLEPFDSLPQLLSFIKAFRARCADPIIIYTGYTEEEIVNGVFKTAYNSLCNQEIIIKFGRFRPNEEKHFDEVLGVYLASSNQYAKRI